MSNENKFLVIEKLASLSTLIDMFHFALQNDLMKDASILEAIKIIEEKVKEMKEVNDR